MMSAKAYVLESGWYREYVRPFGDGLFLFLWESLFDRAKEPGTVLPEGIIIAEIRVKEK